MVTKVRVVQKFCHFEKCLQENNSEMWFIYDYFSQKQR